MFSMLAEYTSVTNIYAEYKWSQLS